MPSLKPSDDKLDERLRLIVESYQRLTGKPLLDQPRLHPVRQLLWQAPVAIVAHGTEADPIFFYATALRCNRSR
jgi:hypothetical protein